MSSNFNDDKSSKVDLVEKQNTKEETKQSPKQEIKLLNIEEIDFTKNEQKVQR